jgi:GMP synthase (glutamine-hydrolysing)
MNEVIVLQHAACETLGSIEDAIAASRTHIRCVRTYAGDQVPASMGSAGGLIVMGGPMGVYEEARFPFLRHELRLIEQALAAGVPVLGICLGSQLLATALGASVRKGLRKEIGWHRVYLEPAASADPLFREAPIEFDAFHWHGDVFDLPANSVRLARSSLTECQAFRYGQNVYGILFHMEVTPDTIAGMINTFSDELQDEGIDAAALASKTATGIAGLQQTGPKIFDNWMRQSTVSNSS